MCEGPGLPQHLMFHSPVDRPPSNKAGEPIDLKEKGAAMSIEDEVEADDLWNTEGFEMELWDNFPGWSRVPASTTGFTGIFGVGGIRAGHDCRSNTMSPSPKLFPVVTLRLETHAQCFQITVQCHFRSRRN